MTKVGRPLTPLTLSKEDRGHLQDLTRKRQAPAREVARAWMILWAAEGLGNDEIAHCVQGSQNGVAKTTSGTAQLRFSPLWISPPAISSAV